ncbi:MAG: lysophospholipid acyltransferase family protein [Deltaproteobacteria bacterium]|nr:lysophospholipid acyltransferase family protein [Deltaproteobacteria bacterium]MBW1818213.1 lysophospholipid acyltransferase family protein [Deltaproteobacteria bacterium]
MNPDKTVHDTAVARVVMRWLALALFRFTGWKSAGKKPCIPKYVIIAAPHTSNWDFFYALCLAFMLEVRPFIMMKGAWFRWPMGPFLRWMGAIPVDRSKSTDMVARSIEAFRARPRMVLMVPPSGTRKKVMYWKTGFYHIARGANVPIVLGYLDYRRKVGGIGPVLHPTGNMEADMKIVRDFYADIEGKYPKKALSAPVPVE